MESHSSPAEELPALYRAVLDGIARLEALGARREAQRVRSAAIRVYSGSWDERGRRRLMALVRDTERVASGDAEPRGERRGLTERSLVAR